MPREALGSVGFGEDALSVSARWDDDGSVWIEVYGQGSQRPRDLTSKQARILAHLLNKAADEVGRRDRPGTP